jgi:hypothetical protein
MDECGWDVNHLNTWVRCHDGHDGRSRHRLIPGASQGDVRAMGESILRSV